MPGRFIQHVERRFDVSAPFRVQRFQTNIEYSTRDAIVRLPIYARRADEVCVRPTFET
ncbi:Uncharacterised protein [Mycobacterium tuberculosis]|nr:Uncharacterised protein [Mycobacterium tuberculosis]CFD74231.1 Uncharacterised protein [Mycobacterium tuberculosis]CFG64872.1 Uncharacterised protein [Mycobacterium tuberculosis]CFG69232.1 Uncharacterised protein [Mycobacterium tuberculosis]CFI08112.1 Uncharacterised protein [Mycobacterium tuberculosis]